jgi:hypothetical protein
LQSVQPVFQAWWLSFQLPPEQSSHVPALSAPQPMRNFPDSQVPQLAHVVFPGAIW